MLQFSCQINEIDQVQLKISFIPGKKKTLVLVN